MTSTIIRELGRRAVLVLVLSVVAALPAGAREEPRKGQQQEFEVLNDRSAGLNARGQFEEALAAADRALELNPRYSFAWNNKCVALLGLGRNNEALEAAEQALAANPSNAVAWTNKALVYRRLEQPDAAIKAMEQAVGLDDKNPLIWYNKACYHAISRDRVKALQSLARAVALEPKLKQLAIQDEDLASLKDDAEFRKLTKH